MGRRLSAPSRTKRKLLRYHRRHLGTKAAPNIGAGLTAGRGPAARLVVGLPRSNRVIFMSDGQPTRRHFRTRPASTTSRREIRARHGISVTSIGLGSDFNEELMESIGLDRRRRVWPTCRTRRSSPPSSQKDLNQGPPRRSAPRRQPPHRPPARRVPSSRCSATRRCVSTAASSWSTCRDFAAGQFERVVMKLTVPGPRRRRAVRRDRP